MTTENILCVPTAILWPDANQTQRPCSPQELEQIIAEHGVYLPRDQCETDETHQQIIPHIVVTSGEHVLCYTRIRGGEKRLDGVLSVGFGGHVNIYDRGVDGPLLNGTIREYDEEISTQFYKPESFDDFSPNTWVFRHMGDAVGRVHTAFMLCDEWERMHASPEIENNVNPVYGWVDYRIIADHPRLEPWGRIALGLIYGEGE